MTEKVTSLRIDAELWRKVKLLAVKRGVTLKSLMEKLISMELKAEELLEGEAEVSTEVLEALKERRRRGLLPFVISSEKSAVELVREGRG